MHIRITMYAIRKNTSLPFIFIISVIFDPERNRYDCPMDRPAHAMRSMGPFQPSK